MVILMEKNILNNNANKNNIDDYSIIEDVKLFWPVLENGIFPKVLSRELSISLLCKIIDERRTFDGYFKMVNASNIFIANEVFEVMSKAVHQNIPVEAISDRILRFRVSKREQQTYVDMKNVIVEYRSILKKNKLFDRSLMIELYFQKLSGMNQYVEYRKKLDTVDLDIMKIDDIKDNQKNIDMLNLKDTGTIDCKNTDTVSKENNDIPNQKNINIRYDTFFDMLRGLESLVSELIIEKKINAGDICVVVPKLTPFYYDTMIDVFEKNGIKIDFAGIVDEVGKTDIGRFAISVLAIKNNCIFLVDEQDKVLLTKIFNDGLSYFDIKENLENYFKAIVDEICSSEIENNSEFLKFIYKKYFEEDEIGIKTIEKISKLLKEYEEFDILGGIEFYLKFIKDSISLFSSKKRISENIDMDSVLFIDIDDLIEYKVIRDHYVLFDVSSYGYDIRVEYLLSTELAFFDDKTLSNIDDNNLVQVHNDYMEYFTKLKVDGLIDFVNASCTNINIYVLESDLSISGFSQENIFRDILIDYI